MFAISLLVKPGKYPVSVNNNIHNIVVSAFFLAALAIINLLLNLWGIGLPQAASLSILIVAAVSLLSVKAELFTAARWLLSLVPVFAFSIIYALAASSISNYYPAAYAILLTLALSPFILLDVKNLKEMSAAAVVISFCLLILPLLSSALTVDVLTLALNGAATVYIHLIVAFLIATFMMCLFVRNYKNTAQEYQLIEANYTSISEKLSQSETEKEESERQLQESKAQDERRQWVNEGLAQFADILRKHQHSTAELSQELISCLVTYMKANQGAIFLLDEDEESKTKGLLNLEAAYAYDRQKFLTKQIAPGQGLVGQAFLEKEYIYLIDIPKNYISIGSGLGDAKPNCVLIFPLKINEKVVGIIELASFRTYNQYQIDFAMKLGENIAGTISNVNTNKKTRSLLEDSQEQTEILKAQEEEMRQNAEELQATQEELERNNNEIQQLLSDAKLQNEKLLSKEKELKQKVEAMNAQYREMQARENVLNETTIISEADLYGTIVMVNDKLCSVSKYTREELIGQPHKIFRHEDMPSALFKNLWETIKAGKAFRGIIKNKAKDDSIYWVDAVIAPVLNENGKPVRYIGIRYVINDHAQAEKLYEAQCALMHV